MPDMELLRNVALSSNICPTCLDAAQQEPMTYEEWANSEWGLPGSDARYCAEACHCVLMPDDIIDQFPAINDKVKLRGDEGSDIRGSVELAPSEHSLKEIMDQWNEEIGTLPKEIYGMPVGEVEAYLRKLYGEWLVGKR
jgi:hypothetical protein